MGFYSAVPDHGVVLLEARKMKCAGTIYGKLYQ